MLGEYETESVDSRYAGKEKPQKPPFKTLENDYVDPAQLSPIMDLIAITLAPDRVRLYKAWQVFLFMQILHIGFTLIICLIAFYFKHIRRAILQYPLFYILAWNMLIPGLLSVHYFPHLARKYPYNYVVFCCTFFPWAYILLFISVYFRFFRSELYLFVLLLIHMALYAKLKSVFQYYYTTLSLQQMLSRNQSDQSSQPDEQQVSKEVSNPDSEKWEPNFMNDIVIQKDENGEDQQEIEDMQEEENEIEEEKKVEPKLNASILLVDEGQFNDEQRSQLMSQQNIKVDEEKQPLGVEEEEEDLLLQLGLDQFKEPYVPPPEEETQFNLEHYVGNLPIITPEIGMSLSHNWIFLICLAIITPTIILLALDEYFMLFLLPPLWVFLIIYIFLIFAHLKVYRLEERQYVLNYSWVNVYYLSTAFWIGDLLYPIVLYNANKSVNLSSKGTRQSRMSLV